MSADKNTYNDILVDNILQTMTSMQADIAISTWFSVLNMHGLLSVKVPNADFYARLWLQASWSENTLRDRQSDARTSFSQLWGEQETGNPRNDNYDQCQPDAFKSAYNQRRLTFLLERAGFTDVVVKLDGESQLIATAKKSMDKGERQVAIDYKNIRVDHKNRYQFACDKLKDLHSSHVLDLACGIGYGSLMLSKATGAEVTGVDIDQNAIDYAKKYYSNEDTTFLCKDAQVCKFESCYFDGIVSFETIEHISFDEELLRIFYAALKPGGYLICSTPNQDVMPFDEHKFRFHHKHYTNSELTNLLSETGFRKVELYMQEDAKSSLVVQGEHGCFTIAVAIK